MWFYYYSDVINGIKMEDAGDTTSAVVDVEASLNSLKLNDLSTPRNVLSASIPKTEPDVFNRLEPGRFGPKGKYVRTYVCMYVIMYVHPYYIATYVATGICFKNSWILKK